MDNLWHIRLIANPFVFQLDKGGKEFKESEALALNIDGQEYLLADLLLKGETLKFTTLSWKGERSEFSSNKLPGQVQIRDHKVCIHFGTSIVN